MGETSLGSVRGGAERDVRTCGWKPIYSRRACGAVDEGETSDIQSCMSEDLELGNSPRQRTPACPSGQRASA